MKYQEFLLQLHAAGSEIAVNVISSPAGEGDGPFVGAGLPQEWSREAPSCLLRDLVSVSAGRRIGLTPEEMGSRLYQALFPTQVRSLLERSFELAQDGGEGLRLKILLNPRDTAVRLLQGLPWEALFREDTGDFLSLSCSTPVVRSLAVPQRPRSSTLSGRLRVLVAQSLPHGAKRLDLERELGELEEISANGSRLEVVPWRACLEELREILQDRGPFDILHFMGHADFLDDRDEGVLLFEKQDGSEDAVGGASLARTLRDFPTLRLMVLNACRTASPALRARSNAFGGAAAALVQAGVPAVIAMQEPVSDEAAIKFSRALYRNLVRARSLEEAVAEARHAVFSINPSGFEWAIPSLFLRSSSPQAPNPASMLAESRDETVHLVDSGVHLFRSGDFSAARQRLELALTREPEAEKPRLFAVLCRMAIGRSLPPGTVAEIDNALARLCRAEDPEVARLARLALAILRFDVVEPRGIRVEGATAAVLIDELARRTRTPLEIDIARALSASRGVRVLLKLQP